jgi:hypothetical protein
MQFWQVTYPCATAHQSVEQVAGPTMWLVVSQCGDVLLVKIPKPVHIFMPNDMTTFKSRAFESARHDFRYVVA